MFGQHDDAAKNDSGTNGMLSAPIVPDSSQPSPAPQSPSGGPTPPTYAMAAPAPSAPFQGSMLESTAPPPPAPSPMGMPPQPPAIGKPGSADPQDDELVSMKQEALKHLQPLIGSLQQSPEEEFRTLMMMIQATDDRSMLKKALESAKKIPDDKIRAQAMLDVINEINYFTQPPN